MDNQNFPVGNSSSSTWKVVAVVIVIVIIGLGAFYFLTRKNVNGSNIGTPETAMSTTAPATQASPAMMASGSAQVSASGMMGAVKEITVTGSNFKFDPSTITVNKGDHVKLTFKNSGGTHDFVIDELNVRTNTIKGGASETVEFTADKARTFKYYCSVGNHRAMGMEGTLTVQ